MAKSSGFSFNVKVKMNSVNKIIKDHGLDSNGRATRFLRNEADRLMASYVPGGAGGELEKLKAYPNNYSIKYISPYAHYQYTGKLMLTKSGSSWAKKGEKKFYTSKKLKYHTSGTGAYWDKLMLQRHRNDLTKDVQNYINSGG